MIAGKVAISKNLLSLSCDPLENGRICCYRECRKFSVWRQITGSPFQRAVTHVPEEW